MCQNMKIRRHTLSETICSTRSLEIQPVVLRLPILLMPDLAPPTYHLVLESLVLRRILLMPNPALPFLLCHYRCRCSCMFPILIFSFWNLWLLCNAIVLCHSLKIVISDRSSVLYGEKMKLKMNYEISRGWCWRWGWLGCSSLLTPLHVAGSDGRPRPWGPWPWHLRGASRGTHLTGIVLQEL